MNPVILELSELKQKAFELNGRVSELTRTGALEASENLARTSLALVEFVSDAHSRSGVAETSYCLACAQNSAAELTSLLYNALGSRQLKSEDFDSLYDDIGEVLRLISGVIRSKLAA